MSISIPAKKTIVSRVTVPQNNDLPVPILLNRELTWLAFNQRVLAEAEKVTNPLLERVKFLAIVDANLDEFFMKRIGGLKQQVGAELNTLSADGRTPQEQIDACYDIINDMDRSIAHICRHLLTGLKKEKINITTFSQLAKAQQQQMRDYFYDNVYPLLTPQAIDPAHPFPFVSNLSLNLLITLSYPNELERPNVMSRLKIPVGQGSRRFIRVGDNHCDKFITLENLIISNMDIIFPQMNIISTEIFRVTRNAVTEQDEERAEDLLELIESELRERRFAPIVRMQFNKGMNSTHKSMLASELQLDENKDVFEVEELMSKRDLFEVLHVNRPDLKDFPHHPIDNASLVNEDNIFHAIRRSGPFLIQLPYESFATSIERFVRDASRDPKVIGIKMTIYRTSSDSKIIKYLIDASRNGKQVTVVVEVKARFDESANIRWANHLEEAGIHVTYGIVGLKTHAKLIYVLRQDYDGLRRYAHIGTGNYHSETARLYSDLGLLTCDSEIGTDLTELFNYLTTGYTPKRNYQKLLPAPRHMKKGLLERIAREIKHAKAGKTALIQLKTNALEDIDITLALYRASQSGVKVDLLIRDTCRLVPGITGLSENIRVISLVGRFLEHTRIYYFLNNGDEEYYIGSADLMKRNLESRVEVIAPIETGPLREQLKRFFSLQLADTQNAWSMQPDGRYIRNVGKDTDQPIIAQKKFIEEANERYKAANRLRLRKPRSIR
ncbi:MAG: polyphosphate kinase 1 [Ostreibacterium sp.]